MRKSITTIVGLAIAFSFMATYAGTSTTPTTPITPPSLPTNAFTGSIVKIDSKLSIVSVKGKNAAIKGTPDAIVTMAFSVTPQTIIKISNVKKALKDLALNMVVLVSYQIQDNGNIALAITNPPPTAPPPPLTPATPK